MTNSMQATLSKAAIYTKQPTREWGDPYLTWGCANVLLRLYESERSNILLLNMYESLWVSVRVVERGSMRVVEVLWFKLLKVWELLRFCDSSCWRCERCVMQSKYSLIHLRVVWGVREFFIASPIFSEYVPKQTKHAHDQTTDMTTQT